MKKDWLFLVMFFLIVSHAYTQSYLILARPIDSSLWRYFNIKGEIVIDLGRESGGDVYPFSEDGVAALGQDVFKLINRKGEVIKTELVAEKIPLKTYRGANPSPFSNGLIIARQRGKYGCLDTLGRIRIPFKYYDVVRFNGGYSIGRIKKDFFVLDTSGKETHIDDTTIVDIEHFQENLAPFESSTGKRGFIDTNGKIVIAAQFAGVGFFSNGLAWARNNNDDDLIGYIDTEGKWIIEPKFAAAKSFELESGLARVKAKPDPNSVLGMEWVYVNRKGEIQNFDTPLRISDFSEGLAICEKDNRYGFINNKGEWVIQPQFNDAQDFKNGFACAKQKRLWGIIDKQGNWVLQPMFEAIKGDLVKVK